MENKKEATITEEEALRLLTNSIPNKNELNIFDNYGNYSFPTDIAMNTPNNACGSITIILSTNSCKNSF